MKITRIREGTERKIGREDWIYCIAFSSRRWWGHFTQLDDLSQALFLSRGEQVHGERVSAGVSVRARRVNSSMHANTNPAVITPTMWSKYVYRSSGSVRRKV